MYDALRFAIEIHDCAVSRGRVSLNYCTGHAPLLSESSEDKCQCAWNCLNDERPLRTNIKLKPDALFSLLASTRMGAYALSIDQTILYWNGSAQRILGHKVEQVIGRRCYEIVGGTVAGSLTPACENGCPSLRCVRDGIIPGSVEMSMLCASGERRLVSLTPMVVAGVLCEAPILVHLFDDVALAADTGRSIESVSDALRRGGAEIVSNHPEDPSVSAFDPKLTARELEVLRLVSLGWDTQRLADELEISHHTARNHIRHFRHKLNANTKMDAVLTAIRLGILAIEPPE